MHVFIELLVAYLLGCLLGGDIVGNMTGGVDLRSSGSGNVGATNALRTKGPLFAIAVLAIDIGKGVLAVLLIPHLPWRQVPALPPQQLEFLCGLAAVVGHCFPLFAGFRGGKGVATALGVSGALLPWALPWMIGIFVLSLVFSGYVALASLLGAAAAVIWLGLEEPAALGSISGAVMIALFLLLLFKHRHNLARLRAGTEHRFERIRVLGRLLRMP